jgi:uncharacterized OB-fold protein
MTGYIKPLPAVQPWSKPFWEGTKEHRLLIQECKACGVKIFYPRKACPECWSQELGWSEASGRGKVYTFTVTLDGVEAKFAPDLPYVLAMIDLEEGIRMMGNIVDCDPQEVTFGMDVEVVFDDVTDEFTLPRWRPRAS